MRKRLITLNPGDKFINRLGVVCTVVSVGDTYDCVEGYDYHCARGRKFDITYTYTLPLWGDELQTATRSHWEETEVELTAS